MQQLTLFKNQKISQNSTIDLPLKRDEYSTGNNKVLPSHNFELKLSEQIMVHNLLTKINKMKEVCESDIKF